MATLSYVGRSPDSDAIIVAKGYADSANAAQALTTTYVNNQIASAAALLTTQSYVDSEDAGLAHKTDVDAADANYVALSALGAVNGVANLDSGGLLVSSLIPTGVPADRVARSYCMAQPGTTRPTWTKNSNTSAPASTGGGTSVTTSITHTPAAGDSAVLLWIQLCDISGTPATAFVSATYGSSKMTLLGFSNYPGGISDSGLWVFGLLGPPSGTSTIRITVTTTAATTLWIDPLSESYAGVGSFGPLAIAANAGANAMSVTCRGDSTQLFANCFVANEVGGNLQTNYNRTQRWYDGGVSGEYAEMIAGDAPGAASVTFSTSNTINAGWVGIVVPLIPTPVPSGNALGVLDVPNSFTATTGSNPTKIAHITVPDPGWPWRPIPFAWVAGDSSGAAHPATRPLGTGSYGLLTVQPPGTSPPVYGMGICTGSYFTDIYPVFPHAAAGQTPTTVPPVTGGLELDLCASLWSGSSYTFYAQGLQYMVLVAPAL